MSELKLPVILKDDVVDLRNSSFSDMEFSKNSFNNSRKLNSFKSVSHTALEERKDVGDFDKRKTVEQKQLHIIKNLGKNHSSIAVPVQNLIEEKKYKFRARKLDPRFRRSRSPNKNLSASQNTSGTKTTYQKPKSVNIDSENTTLVVNLKDPENKINCCSIDNSRFTEKGTMTDYFSSSNLCSKENFRYENVLQNEKFCTVDSYWNDPHNIDKRLKPPFVKAKSSISSFTMKKSTENKPNGHIKNILCPRCHYCLNKDNLNDASTYVYDDVTDSSDVQPIFSKLSDKISSFTKNLDKSKIDITKFLIGYVSALIIVTLTIGGLILLDPTSLLDNIEKYLYEPPQVEVIEINEPGFFDNFSAYSFISLLQRLLDQIVDVLTKKRTIQVDVETTSENIKGWLPF